MTATTEQNQQKDYIDKTYFDATTGEEITVRKTICKRCGNLMRLDGTGHNECRKEFLMEEAEHMEKLRQQECLKQFGKVLSRQEQTWRTYPDSRTFGYNETYNQYLKRIEEEKKQAHYKKLRERDLRKERLPQLEQEIIALKAKIARDDLEASEEPKQKEQGTENVTNQHQTLQTQIEEDEETEARLQAIAKAKEQTQ